MKKIEIVGVPSGQIKEIPVSVFDELLNSGIIRFDDEWTEETPNGQYSFLDTMNFKYKLLPLFFDADFIACVFLDEVKELYPFIEDLSISEKIGEIYHQREFESFSWDIGDKIVMTVTDLQPFVNIYKEVLEYLEVTNERIEDIDLSMIGVCSVSGVVLMPHDELYVDGVTGAYLSDEHSKFDEENDYYITSL